MTKREVGRKSRRKTRNHQRSITSVEFAEMFVLFHPVKKHRILDFFDRIEKSPPEIRVSKEQQYKCVMKSESMCRGCGCKSHSVILSRRQLLAKPDQFLRNY